MRTHYLLASLVLACAIPAQTTWLIGPSGHAEIRDVMQLVQDGDTVLVDAGTYFNFDCDKAVTIRAATPGTVTVNFDLASLPSGCGCQCLATKGPTRLQPPPGKSMHIVDIAFGAYQSITPCFSLLAHQVQVTSGRVTFDDCTIDRLSITGAAVHLQDCTIVSQLAGPAIEATQADITIVGGQVTGSNKSSQFLANNAYDGIKTIDSRLHASHVVVTGGDPLTSTIGTFGIHAIGGSLWLSDAAVTGNMQCAVQATGLVRIDRSTLAGSGANCASSPTGASLQGMQRQGGIEIGWPNRRPASLLRLHEARRAARNLARRPADLDRPDATVLHATRHRWGLWPVNVRVRRATSSCAGRRDVLGARCRRRVLPTANDTSCWRRRALTDARIASAMTAVKILDGDFRAKSGTFSDLTARIFNRQKRRKLEMTFVAKAKDGRVLRGTTDGQTIGDIHDAFEAAAM